MSFRFKCAIAMFVFSCGVPGPVSAGPLEDGLQALEDGNYERAMRLLRRWPQKATQGLSTR